MEISNKPLALPAVITIASSDNSGGAGIQMDVYAFNMLKVHGCSVITCVTAQNSREVRFIEPVPYDVIDAQLDTLVTDFEVKSMKTGLLGKPTIVKIVGMYLEEYIKSRSPEFNGLVVDPVLTTTVSGKLKDDEELISAYKSALIPLAYIFTPNVPEAEALLDRSIDIESGDGREEALKDLQKLGPRNVLLKGGHGVSNNQDRITDWLMDEDSKLHGFVSKYHKEGPVHGTGCMLSALITAHLALGYRSYQAVAGAKTILNECIEHTVPLGKGSLRYFNTQECGGWQMHQARIMSALQASKNNLLQTLVPEMIPEVGINFGYAIPAARTIDDICALEARIIKTKGGVQSTGGVAFGASNHVARIILSAMEADLRYRSALNLRYSEAIVEAGKKLGLAIGTFDRSEEPTGEQTMDWGTRTAINKLGQVPDLIYDLGGPGKEPMVRILGQTPGEVIQIVSKLKDLWYEESK
jgi:hydroxymethylpyrimidine/phosphomethylpyrimidine kinase